MLSEFALSIFVEPVGVMLIGGGVCIAFALRELNRALKPRDMDALAELFERENFHTQMREAALLNASARARRRAVRGRQPYGARSRDEMLVQIAAVMRGSEPDAATVRETTRILAGVGFVIVDDRVQHSGAVEVEDIIPFGDFDEVKLLPPPCQTKAA